MRLGLFCLHKPSLKLFLACTVTSLITLYLFWNGCKLHSALPTRKSEEIRSATLTVTDCSRVIAEAGREEKERSERAESSPKEHASKENVCPNVEEIDGIVNGEKKFTARLEGSEAYVPFSYVKEYFDIYGEVQVLAENTVLDWRHSYSEVHHTKPGTVYQTKDPFLWFETYHVEGRTRVKCVSGIENVPVSSQWNPKGHFYPIQIAQYGLSHYNMFVLNGDSNRQEKVFEDAETEAEVNWNWATPQGTHISNVFDKARNTRVFQFSTTGLTGEGIKLSVDSATKDFILSFDLFLQGQVRVSVVIETDNSVLHTVHYITNNEMMVTTNSQVSYGIGDWKGWRRIVRNLDTDLRKALSADRKNNKRGKYALTEIQSFTLNGKGSIDNISLAHSAHAQFFLTAADWFLRHQSEEGNWPISVKRKVLDDVTLSPGWHSAMAQGQAMSLLTRAYLYTKDQSYLKAALRATKLFKIKSKDNGVLTVLWNQYPWYEEYPTTPPLLVLNGFIYSLIGLYDLKLTAGSEQGSEAAELFDQGMRSLRVMLPLFDAGSGTFYDLRHITMHVEPNLARWDYHTLHVSQLYFLSKIDSDPVFKTTAMRWEGYAKGKRAKHN